MSLGRTVPLTALMLAGIIAAMVVAARAGRSDLVFPFAFLVPCLFAVVGWGLNARLWSLPALRVTDDAIPVAARRNAILLALAYAWGAVTLLTIYPLAGLRWYHWWQYGGLMALVAAGIAVYAAALARPGSFVRSRPLQLKALQLTIVHAMAIVGGLGWLILSGKAASGRDDWAANAVFLAGGAALAIVSAMAAYTQMRLARR
jgi:hypothetical protein